MDANITDYRDLAKYCMSERYWPYYIASIVATFFGGLLFILIQRGLQLGIAWIRKRKRINQFTNQSDWRFSGRAVAGSSYFYDVPTSNSLMSDLDHLQKGDRCKTQCLMAGFKIKTGKFVTYAIVLLIAF